MDNSLRLIDLVPRRWSVLALGLCGGLAVIAGLEFLHAWQAGLNGGESGISLAALNLSLAGNLGNWFSSLLLLSAAGMAWLVYSVRRHRTDDYHGRYRIWLWAALCWFLLAADVAADLHDVLKQIMIHITGTPLGNDGVSWWMIPGGIAFCAVASRLILDMRPCRLAITALLLAAAAYLTGAVTHLGWMTIQDASKTVMIQSGAVMVGHLMLFLSMAVNARFVILDAEGLLPPRKTKPKTKREPKLYVEQEDEEKAEANGKSAGATDEWMRVDSPVGAPQPVLRRAASTPLTTSAGSAVSPPVSASAATPAFSTTPTTPPITRPLTKQEKKALKERLLRERMERERQQKSGWK